MKEVKKILYFIFIFSLFITIKSQCMTANYNNTNINKEINNNFKSILIPNHVAINNNQIILYMKVDPAKRSFRGGRSGLGAVFSSNNLYRYGTFIAKIKAGSTSLGVVSSFIIESDNGGKISFDITGKNRTIVHTNFQANRQETLVNMIPRDIKSDLTATWHVYQINWTPQSIIWSVDGNIVRTVTNNEAGDDYPRSPSHLRFSIWDGGSLNALTASWAGSPTNFRNNPTYSMYVDSIIVNC